MIGGSVEMERRPEVSVKMMHSIDICDTHGKYAFRIKSSLGWKGEINCVSRYCMKLLGFSEGRG